MAQVDDRLGNILRKLGGLGPGLAADPSTLKQLTELMPRADRDQLLRSALIHEGWLYVGSGEELFLPAASQRENVILAQRTARRKCTNLASLAILAIPFLRERAKPAWVLSGGQKRILSIVVACLLAPKGLLLHRPFEELDDDNKAALKQWLEKAGEEISILSDASD